MEIAPGAPPCSDYRKLSPVIICEISSKRRLTRGCWGYELGDGWGGRRFSPAFAPAAGVCRFSRMAPCYQSILSGWIKTCKQWLYVARTEIREDSLICNSPRLIRGWRSCDCVGGEKKKKKKRAQAAPSPRMSNAES